MSDIHVLDGNGETWRLCMHFPVPDTENAVGVNHRTALVGSGIGVQEGGRRTILTSGTGPGEITTAEEDLLDSGALFEHVAPFRAESGGTSNAELRAAIREFYAAKNDEIQAQIGYRLRFYGHTESAT